MKPKAQVIETRSSRSVTESSKSVDQPDSWTNSTGAKIATASFCLIVVCFLIFEIKSFVHGGMPGDPNTSMYVCSETGKAFAHKNGLGEQIPILSPFSGKNTGYPATPCYWTATGEVKSEPTWVLLNEDLGKQGPTFCPDCGRLVKRGASIPVSGDRPPPTREELLHAYPNAFKTGVGR